MGRENLRANNQTGDFRPTYGEILKGVADLYGIESIYDKSDKEIHDFFECTKKMIELGRSNKLENNEHEMAESSPAEDVKNDTKRMIEGLGLAYDKEITPKYGGWKECTEFIQNMFECYKDYDDAAKVFDNLYKAVYREMGENAEPAEYLSEVVENPDLKLWVKGQKVFTPEEYAKTIGIYKENEAVDPEREEIVRKELESQPKDKDGNIVKADWEEEIKVKLQVGESVDKTEEVSLGDISNGIMFRKKESNVANKLLNKDGLKNELEQLNSATIFANSKYFNKILEAYDEYNKAFGDKSGTLKPSKEQLKKLQNLVNACDNYLDAKDKKKDFVPKTPDDTPHFVKASGLIRYKEIRALSKMIKDNFGDKLVMTNRDKHFEGLQINENTKGTTQKQGDVVKNMEKGLQA